MPYANPQRAKEAALERYYRNRKKRVAQMRAYYRRNPEAWARWRKENPIKAALSNSRRRIAVREMNQQDREYFALLYKDPCSYCGGQMAEVDHIVPLSTGGGPDWENLTAACKSCNQSKNASSVLAFMLRRCDS